MKLCYIFDIDGTLADCSHRLHHIQGEKKDWRAFFADCAADKPIRHMTQLLVNLWDGDHEIVLVSGRSGECRAQTEAWFAAQRLPQLPLYMRKAGDHRPDDIVKGELCDKIIEDGYLPFLAFDDRNSVVKAWRKRGIPCCQVAEGDF